MNASLPNEMEKCTEDSILVRSENCSRQRNGHFETNSEQCDIIV